jgi:hypothetical protein
VTLLEFTLSAMLALSPGRYHAPLAIAIAAAVEAAPAIFQGDADKTKTAALMVAVSFRESSFTADAVGDNGHAVCAFQIYDGPKSLLTDTDACAREGLRMLRESAKVDPANPVAFYARGPRYRSDSAQSISRDRMNLAKWAKAKVGP